MKLHSIAYRNCIPRDTCMESLVILWKTLRCSSANFSNLHWTSQTLKRNMLLVGWLSLFGLAIVRSAAITPSPHLIKETQPPPLRPRNKPTAVTEIPPNLNRSLIPVIIDPRLTYDIKFANQLLNKKSAYMNTLLALADLSTKGWTPVLGWASHYSFSNYGDVSIFIHASQNPSTLEYRYAIWGLYLAILETSARGFRACVSTLYWSPRVGERPHVIGCISIVGGSPSGIGSNNSTEDFLKTTFPTQASSPDLALANSTTASSNSTSLASEKTDIPDLKIDIRLLGKGLDIDGIFRTIYTGVVQLASRPQSQRVDEPGVIDDPTSRTFLRWDSSYLTVEPSFESRYLIAALAKLPVFMYEQDRFEDATFVVYVDEIEVGRGWLYKRGVGGVSNAAWCRRVWTVWVRARYRYWWGKTPWISWWTSIPDSPPQNISVVGAKFALKSRAVQG